MPASTRRSAAPSRHRELRSADDGDEENCVPHHRPRPQQRKPSTHATRRVSLEGAFREITNHYTSGTARGTGTGRGSDKSGKQMSQRAAKLLSHSNSDELTDAIQEVEEWAEALNETRGDEMCDDAFEGLEDDQSDESDYDEVDDDEYDALHGDVPENKKRHARSQNEIKKMREVLEISSKVREMCDARGMALETARAEIESLSKRAESAESERDEVKKQMRDQSDTFQSFKTESQKALETKSKQLEDATTEHAISTGTLKSKNRTLSDEVHTSKLDTQKLKNALRDAEMELQVLTIEHNGNTGASEAAAAACVATAAAEAEAGELKGKLIAKEGELGVLKGTLSGLRNELRKTRAEATGVADTNEVLSDELSVLTRTAETVTFEKLEAEKSAALEEQNVALRDALESTLESTGQKVKDLEAQLSEQLVMLEQERTRAETAETLASETKSELAVKNLSDSASERQKKALETKITELELELVTLKLTHDTQDTHSKVLITQAEELKVTLERVTEELTDTKSELTSTTAELSALKVIHAAVEKQHVETLHSMELEVDTARQNAKSAELAASEATTAAELSASSCADAFETAKRSAMDFADARDEAERLECELGDAKREIAKTKKLLEEERLKVKSFNQESKDITPVTVLVTVIDDTMTGYDDAYVHRRCSEAREEATASTTSLMEDAVESAVHIARREAAIELKSAVATARAVATATLDEARASTRLGLGAAEHMMRLKIEDARNEANEGMRKALAQVDRLTGDLNLVSHKPSAVWRSVAERSASEGEAKIVSLEHELGALEAKLASLETERESEVSTLSQKLTRVGHVTIESEVTRASLETERDALKLELGMCQSRLASLETGRVEDEAKLGSLETELARCQTELSKCQENLASSNAKLAEYQYELVDCRADLAESNKEFTVLQSRCVAVETELVSVTALRDALSEELASTQSTLEKTRDDAAQKDADIAELTAKHMLQRDFSVSPSPIRFTQSAGFTSGNGSRTEQLVSDGSVTASASTPFSNEKSEEDEEVIEHLKTNLAESYERERGLELELILARNVIAQSASKQTSKDISVSPNPSEEATIRLQLKNSLDSISQLKSRISRLTHEASYEQSIRTPQNIETSFTKALGGTQFMENSGLLSVESKDVSAYVDANTPDSIKRNETNSNNNLFREMMRGGFGVGPFSITPNNFQFPNNVVTKRSYDSTPQSAVSIAVSSASTPPAYDTVRYEKIMKKGNEEIANLKQRVLGFTPDRDDDGEE